MASQGILALHRPYDHNWHGEAAWRQAKTTTNWENNEPGKIRLIPNSLSSSSF